MNSDINSRLLKLNRVTYLSLGKSLILRNRKKDIKVAYNL